MLMAEAMFRRIRTDRGDGRGHAPCSVMMAVEGVVERVVCLFSCGIGERGHKMELVLTNWRKH